MLTKLLHSLIALKRPETIDCNDRNYMISDYSPVKEPTATTIKLNTLTGVIDYIKSGIDINTDTEKSFFIHITEYNQVSLRSNLFGDWQQREALLASEADVPQLSSHWMDIEKFIINLNSKFVHSFDHKDLAKLVSGLTQDASKNLKDNGITQTTVVRSGVTLNEEQTIKNIVKLQPYKTFPEIKQPEIEYLFRLTQASGPPECALFEADGGRWELETMHKIKAWFEGRMEEEGIKMDVIA